MRSTYQITRAAEPASLAAFRDLIQDACEQHPAVDEQTCYDLKLAVEEACTNIIIHGYAGMNPGSIILKLVFTGPRAVVTLTDFGHPFEPCEPAVPDVQANLRDGVTGGFGLFLIYQTMDSVGYRTAGDGNHLTFVKVLRENQNE